MMDHATDEPVAGFYRMRMRMGGVPVGIRIWFGPPHDPVTGEVLDRGWRWQVHINGEMIDIERVWPVCARQVITEIEYERHCVKQKWARQHVPDDALAQPRKSIDHLQTPMMF
jgi:hypothetical protein